MNLRTGPILGIAFGILIALIAFSGLSALRRAQRLFEDISSLHDRYQTGERILNEVRNEINLSGVLLRDYLLDRSNLTAESYRQQLLAIRASTPKQLAELKAVLGLDDAATLQKLRDELEGYWDSFEPIFGWTADQKLAFSSSFLRRQVLPRRDAALSMAREIRHLNEANLMRQRKEVDQKENELPMFVGRMLTATLLLGLLVAGGSIYRITRLEQKAEEQRRRTQSAEQEMRRLSLQLVKAQEEERRSLARELHDEVGQMLTAQRMELRNLKALRNAPEEEFLAHLEDSALLSENALRAVRGLAMGLRPSMLDDIGLGPAVEWQAREFSRRYGVPVAVRLEGALDTIPDAHRTCIYRIVQEALTNCARHARAGNIRVAVHGQPDRVSVAIQDDGAGFNAGKSRGPGMGLIGMEERVKELGGALAIYSQPGKGTAVSAEIPLENGEEGAVA